MTTAGILIGYARCSTDDQDLTAHRQTLLDLGVAEDRIYLDHGPVTRQGLTRTSRVSQPVARTGQSPSG